MNVLHLSTSDIDNGGARAAYRLHKGLQAVGCKSQMLVRAKFSVDSTVIADKSILTKLAPPISGIPLRFYPNCNSTMFSAQWFPDVLAAKATQANPDIIHLHWICNGFLKIETLAKFGKPLVWTLHDMWPFTGGCDYTRDCEKYKESCGNCPQLDSHRSWDLSRWVWQRKAKSWRNLNLTLVATSSWMAECARSSSLFRDRRVEQIPLGLDTEKYKPINQHVARELLGLPLDKQLVLFGAINATSDSRKGFHLLLPALQQLSKSGWKEQLELIVFGSSQPDEPIDLGFRSHYLGRVHDDISLALIYSAADVMVVPSVQEAFGQTASESLACGTPVAAFNAAGLRDIVDHQQNGYLATPFEVDDLAKGIAWILEDRERNHQLRHHARKKSLQEFASEVQARRYLSLYEQVLRE
ncbi:glycosyltransferase [Leptolyngbyaceae cyanobacterium JSC-12]|nr:glycosyltransferase [Leptolyngbyaceae cyanobacterium JSC-12]